MSVANLEAYALSQGIKTSWKEMDQSQQVMLRYNYLMSVSKDAQGDFAKTSDSFSNQLRILQGRIKQMSTNLGKLLLPATQKVVSIVVKLVGKFGELPQKAQLIIIVLGAIAAVIPPLIIVGGVLIGALGGIAAGIAAIGAPAALIIGVIGWLGAEITILLGIIGIAAYKTGLLEVAFNKVKSAINFLTAIIKGDANKVINTLIGKFGYSSEKAQAFMIKVNQLRGNVIKLIGTVKDVTKVIGAIFSGNSQRLINLLIGKFGMTRYEAQAFSIKVNKLKEEFIKLGGKIKSNGINMLNGLIKILQKTTKFLYEHRKEIIKVIEFLVKLGTAGAKLANKIVSAFEKINKAIGATINKISKIKFPSPPSWFPGFAAGITNFAGGMAMVGENGPEIVRLPRGSDVIPNNKIKDFEIKTSQKIGGNVVNDTKTVNVTMNNYISKEVDSNKVINDFMRILKSNGVNIRHA